jgi:ubiquinol-cytochrome c reductase iron-sulfur subunit
MRVAIFLVASVVGALGATAAAAFGAAPALFAMGLAVAFAGLAGAAAAAAVALHAPDDLKDPREARGPSDVQPIPTDGVTRGAFNKLWLAAAGAFAVLGIVPLVSLARKPGRSVRTGWRAGLRLVDERNQPIRVDRLIAGGVETVFPQDGVDIPDASAVLIRLPEEDVRAAAAPTAAASAGYVAFSKICTHAGCPVALYRAHSKQLFCPCHQSLFDVVDGAKNVSGPAPRPLPGLPLDVDANGYLIARGDFDGPVGPDDWGRVT